MTTRPLDPPASAPTPAAQTQFRDLMLQHMQWLMAMHGVPAVSAVLGIALNMGATLASRDGAPLPPELQRFRDAALAARVAYERALASGIVAAPADTRVNGKRLR